jgi:hypothetical protein
MKNESKNEILSISIDDEFEILANTLGTKSTTTFDNHIANVTSINEAIFISYFVSIWKKKSKNGEMCIIPKVFCKHTCLTIYIFRKIVKKWEKLGIVRTECRGIPRKKWYHLNEPNLCKYLKNLYSKPCNIPSTAELFGEEISDEK